MRHTTRKLLSILLALVIMNGLLPASEIMAMTEDFAEDPAIEIEDSTEVSAEVPEIEIESHIEDPSEAPGSEVVYPAEDPAEATAAENVNPAEIPSAEDDDLVLIGSASSEDLPSRFDLRDYGLVTPVKNQMPWNTCWAFSAAAAAETSILTALDTTYEESGLDLSERHSAWYTNQPLADGICESQTGEGFYPIDENDSPNAVFSYAGQSYSVGSIWASGMGPAFESDYPYRGKDGLLQYDYLLYNRDDWISQEKSNLRKEYAFELRIGWVTERDIEIFAEEDYEEALDSCSEYDYYNPLDDWTINEGRPQESMFVLKDNTIFEYNQYLSDEQTSANDIEAITALKKELTEGRAVAIELNVEEGLNTETWACYTRRKYSANHGCCIVGWDDNYPAENFKQLPPADGAWLVKNSWGSETDAVPDALVSEDGTARAANGGKWGITDEAGRHTGYFWLSYYYRSVVRADSFTFDVRSNTDYTDALQYDYVPVSDLLIDFTQNREESAANIYPIDHDVCVTDIGTRISVNNSYLIGDYNVAFTLYRLDDGATLPTQGVKIGEFERNFRYAGYHRVQLDSPVYLKAGDRLAVVVTVAYDDGNGNVSYSCSASSHISKDNRSLMGALNYAKVIVNPGESFLYRMISEEGDYAWIDIAGPMGEYLWNEMKNPVDTNDYSGQSIVDNTNIDNFCIKVFTAPVKYKIAEYNGSAANPALVQASDQTEEQLSMYLRYIESVTVNGTEYDNNETPIIVTADVVDENGNVTVPAGTIDLNAHANGKKIFDGGNYELTVRALNHDDYTFALAAPSLTGGGNQQIVLDQLEKKQIGLSTDGNPAYLRAVKVDGKDLSAPADYEAGKPGDSQSVLFTKIFQKTLKVGDHKIEIVYANGAINTRLTVKQVKVTGVKLNKTSARLLKGKTLQLKATVSPGNATDRTVTWSSSNTAAATVDKNGKVTAKKTGTAKITVTTKDGGKKAICTVTVYERVPLYRFFNIKTGDHMYTVNEAERKALIKNSLWRAEGIACYVPKKSSKPVYRLYNRNTGDHMFTTNANERRFIIKAGWVDQGIGFYSDTAKTVPVYRMYNPHLRSGYHFFTANKQERTIVLRNGWKDEKIGFYGV